MSVCFTVFSQEVRNLKRLPVIAAVLLSLVLAAPSFVAAALYPLQPGDVVIGRALDYLASQQASDGSIGSYADSAWACIAIAAAGEDPAQWDNGGPSLLQYLKAGHPDVTGEFNMGTFLARMMLVAAAVGEDASAFGSWSGANAGVSVTNGDYLSALLTLHDGEQFLQDLTGDPDSARTLNDDYWALRAIVSTGTPTGSTLVQSTADFIAARQEDDGGWTWATPLHSWYMPDSSDTDNTAAAIVALTMAGRASSQSVRDGLAFLRADQADSGGFTNPWSGVNVQSSVWALDAIASARQDPARAPWAPDGISAVEYVLGSQEPNGSFGDSVRATSDAICALLGQYYHPGPRSVGGMALPPDKLALALLLALAVAAALVPAALLLRRAIGSGMW